MIWKDPLKDLPKDGQKCLLHWDVVYLARAPAYMHTVKDYVKVADHRSGIYVTTDGLKYSSDKNFKWTEWND